MFSLMKSLRAFSPPGYVGWSSVFDISNLPLVLWFTVIGVSDCSMACACFAASFIFKGCFFCSAGFSFSSFCSSLASCFVALVMALVFSPAIFIFKGFILSTGKAPLSMPGALTTDNEAHRANVRLSICIFCFVRLSAVPARCLQSGHRHPRYQLTNVSNQDQCQPLSTARH